VILFRVAAYLGRTVREIERGMSARELAEWAVYIERNPPVAEVIDWQLSAFMSLFHSAHRASNSAAIPADQWSLFEQLRPKTPAQRAAQESERIKRMFGVL